MRSRAGSVPTTAVLRTTNPARAGIAALGSALPETTVDNDQLAPRLGVDDEWIASRTGVRQRRHAGPAVTLTDLAALAAERALFAANLEPRELDRLYVATATADDRMPNAAPLVAERIGAANAGTFDVGAACNGFLSALDVAAAAVEAGRAGTALVIGADLMSRVLDLDDPRTAGLFGDGAGAAVVQAGGAHAIGPVQLRADGSGARAVVTSWTDNKLRMDGRATFRAAVARLCEVTSDVVSEAGLSLADVDLFVYHQANSRILAAVGERLGLEAARVVDVVATLGNTSAASIPLALERAQLDGRLRPNSTVLVGAFGAGFSWGGTILEWGVD